MAKAITNPLATKPIRRIVVGKRALNRDRQPIAAGTRIANPLARYK